MAEPLLTNERAEREWAWLVARVGESTALDALARLPGGRRPYPLNIARVLGLALPEPEALPPLTTAVSRDIARAAMGAIQTDEVA